MNPTVQQAGRTMRGDAFFREAAKRPPFSKLHPRMAQFFKDYLAHEKVIEFRGRRVVNTHFPPWPGPAFDNLVEGFSRLGDAQQRRLYSVTLAVTNRCPFRCWHCYNAGRREEDLPLEVLRRTAAQLQDMGAVTVTLTGGEPMLRDDLEEIVGLFDRRACLTLGTTGSGLTPARARALAGRGLFAAGISLDAADAAEHDRLRGVEGAFRIALDALRAAADAGLYPYVVSVVTREFLEPGRFWRFMAFARDAGALEVHLLEPSATGRLAGRSDVLLRKADRDRMDAYQKQVAGRDDLPILSSYTYLESGDAFGCGAGLTHLYVDGSGEVCPCQLVPLSFGNVRQQALPDILKEMGCRFRRPHVRCVGKILAPHIPEGTLPMAPAASAALCDRRLPKRHPAPRFFRVCESATESVGERELREAYDRVRGDYDEFWLAEAARPIEELVARLDLSGCRRIFEAGCGTGCATAMLAGKMPGGCELIAVDLSQGMIAEARKRLAERGLEGVRFIAGDALASLAEEREIDLLFSSWVLGYIPLEPFFAAAARALRPGGKLAFVVHRENSPREPLEIFGEIVAEDPSVLTRRVAFDFPRDADHVRDLAQRFALPVQELREGAVTFRYDSPAAVLEHLLKSGAGTAFHDAVDRERRGGLEAEFLRRLQQRHAPGAPFAVVHDYVACIAAKSR